MRKPFPQQGRSKDDVIAEMHGLKSGDFDYEGGKVPLYIFDGGKDVFEVGQAAYNEFFKENALGGKRAFPSVLKMEKDVVGFGLDLLNGPEGSIGFMTTGGTESIIQAVQTARNYARSKHGDAKRRGNIVGPFTMHPAFDKAARLMDLEIRRIKQADDFRCDVAAMAEAVDDETVMIVGSAPCYPFGVVDRISELSDLAIAKDLWLHVDACVGGYILPFARMIGRDIPEFDFGIPGVCSMSADLHKFGFCPKPASTVFYRRAEYAEFHAFDFDEWPNGRFLTETICGTRPAGGVAGAWGVMNYLGTEGYKRVATELLSFIDQYRERLGAIDGIRVLGNPHASIVSYTSDEFDIFAVAELLKEKGWMPGLLQEPRGIHQMMSLAQSRVLDQYVADVTEAVAQVRAAPGKTSKLEATY
jgi:glutamate/tyrosine decarboxylase-like PLP-dependent enzyme